MGWIGTIEVVGKVRARLQFRFSWGVFHITVLGEEKEFVDSDRCAGRQCLCELLMGAVRVVVMFINVVPGCVLPKSGSIAEEERAAQTLSSILRFAR